MSEDDFGLFDNDKKIETSLLVPKDSPIQSIRDLKGKRISVPAASTAHAFLLRAIQDQGWDPEKDVSIVVQTPEIVII